MMLVAGLGRSTDDGAKVAVIVFSRRADLSSITGDRYRTFVPDRNMPGAYAWSGYAVEQASGFYSLDPDGEIFAYAADVLDDKAFRIPPTAAAIEALPFRAPAWLQFGFTIYVAGFRMDDDRKRGSISDASADAFGLLRDKGWTDVRLPLEGRPAPEGGDEEQSWNNACWLLVSYFRVERSQEFSSYLARLEAGESPKAAFAAAFHGLAPRDVEPLVRQYVARGLSPKAVTAEPYRGPLRASRLDGAEVHATWAEAYRKAATPMSDDRQANLERAAAEEKEALRLDPDNVTVRLAQVRSLPAADRLDRLRELSRKKPEDPRVSIALAAELSPDRDAETLALLDRCCATPSASEPAADALRAQALFRMRDVRGAVSSAEAALRHGVRAPSMLRLTATAEASNGHCDEAAYLQRKAARLLPSAAPIASAKGLFDELQAYEDGCSVAPEPSRPAGLSRPIRDAASCPPGPSYPLAARVSGGAVELEYTLSASGHVYGVHAVDSSAPAGVFLAADEWLRSCAFTPAHSPSGEAVPVRMRMTFRVGK
jgi:hypothetical protein